MCVCVCVCDSVCVCVCVCANEKKKKKCRRNRERKSDACVRLFMRASSFLLIFMTTHPTHDLQPESIVRYLKNPSAPVAPRTTPPPKPVVFNDSAITDIGRISYYCVFAFFLFLFFFLKKKKRVSYCQSYHRTQQARSFYIHTIFFTCINLAFRRLRPIQTHCGSGAICLRLFLHHMV